MSNKNKNFTRAGKPAADDPAATAPNPATAEAPKDTPESLKEEKSAPSPDDPSAKGADHAPDAEAGKGADALKADEQAGADPDQSKDDQKDPDDVPKEGADQDQSAQKDPDSDAEPEPENELFSKADETDPDKVPDEETQAAYREAMRPADRDTLDGLVARTGAQGWKYRGERRFSLVKPDNTLTPPYEIGALDAFVKKYEAEKAELIARGVNSVVAEEYDAAAGNWLEDQIKGVCDRFGATDFDLTAVEEGEDQIIKLLKEGKDGKPELIVEGTLTELQDLADAEYLKGLREPLDPEEMKVRHRDMSRRKPLRVVKAFDLGEVLPGAESIKFEPGEIFDWASLNLKPFHIARIYARKLVRHAIQDDRVIYPFRAPVRVPAPVLFDDALTAAEKDEALKVPEGFTLNQTEISARLEAADKAKREGKKFTRAGEHLK